jgi:hypothetical protein
MTQTEMVLEHLRTYPDGLTQMDAYRLGMGTRLAARIADARQLLRRDEDIIARTEAHPGGTHARYVLVVKEPDSLPLWPAL